MRSKDRLEELRHLASSAGVYHDTVVSLDAGKEPHRADIDDLLKEVEEIRGWIHDVNHNTQLIRRLHSDPTYHTNKQLQEQLESVVQQSSAAALRVCGALRGLGARAASGTRGASGRMARLQYAAARRLYADALHAHHHALHLLKDHQLRLLQDQIKLTNLTISDEECEHLLESNNICLFVDNLRAETAEARLALREAETRREELARVEAALAGVRDLFLQLAHLVSAQQEQIDTVEYYALQASEHVETGGQHLLKGTVSRRKAKKKKIGVIICVTTGVLIVLLVLVCT